MRIMYTTPNTFTSVNAGALRNVTVAAALAAGGSRVWIVTADPAGSEVDPELAELCGPSGITVLPRGLEGPRDRPAAVVLRNAGGGVRDLAATLDQLQPDRVLHYGADPVSFARLRRASRRRQFSLIVDLTEWHNVGDWRLGRLDPHAWTHSVAVKRLMPSADGGVAISARLASLLGRTGTRTLVVPPLTYARPDLADRSGSDDPRIRLVSVGTDVRPGGKDALGLILVAEALHQLDPGAEKYVVDVVGPELDAVSAVVPTSGMPHLLIHGRRNWRETLAIVARARASVAIRDMADRRVNYGFPSKVPESLAVGTAVVANPYSDICEHIVDGRNGLIAPDLDVPSLRAALQRIPDLQSPAAIAHDARMRYDPSAWTTRLTEFLASIEPRHVGMGR